MVIGGETGDSYVIKKTTVSLGSALFHQNLSAHRFQDAGTLALYRVSDKRCDPKTGEVSLDIIIEKDNPFNPPLNPPRRETVYLRDHYKDRAEEIPLDSKPFD